MVNTDETEVNKQYGRQTAFKTGNNNTKRKTVQPFYAILGPPCKQGDNTFEYMQLSIPHSVLLHGIF